LIIEDGMLLEDVILGRQRRLFTQPNHDHMPIL